MRYDEGHSHPQPRYHTWGMMMHVKNPLWDREIANGAEYTNHNIDYKVTSNEGNAKITDPKKLENYEEPRIVQETRPKNIYVNWIIKARDV